MGVDRIIGAGLGLAAAVAVAAAGLAKGLPGGTCVLRALAAGALGFLAGWLVFGKVGLSLIREAAGPAAPPGGEKPAAPAGPSAPPGDRGTK